MSSHVTVPDTLVPVLPPDPSSPPGEAQKQKIERKKSYGPVLEFLKNTCKKVETEDSQARLEILRQQNRCQAYYDDRQYGKWNDRGEWEEMPYDPRLFRPIDNKYKVQIDKLQMEMARSSVDLNVEAVDQTDSAMVEAAEFLKSRIDANRKRLFIQRPEFILAENMSLLLKTITYRYTYFDKNAEDGPKEKRPKFGNQSIGEEKSLNVCAVCKMPRQEETSDTGEPSPCPNCGSTSTKTLSTSPVEMMLPSGEETVPSGLPRCIHADPTMVQVSMNARNMQVSSSSYLIWTQMIERGKVEKQFPEIVIPSSSDTDEQAKYRRDNETAVSNSPFESLGATEVNGGEQFEKLKFKLIWLDRWVYEDYADSREWKLPDGRTLPPNTPLVQFFPSGMCVAKVGETILALYHEDKNKKWSACVYGLRESAWHGSGTNSLIPNQITVNDLLAYRVANAYYSTFRREFIRQGALSGDQLPKMTEVGVVNNLDEGGRIIGNAYDQAPPIPLSPEVGELSQEQTGAMQEQAGTSSMSQVGTQAEQQGLGTATGIAYMRDQQVGRMGPNLMLKAALEVETSIQLGELEQQNYSRQQLLAFGGLNPTSVGNLGYTQRGVDAFINSDIRADFLVTPAQGSWMPTTEQEKKADALAMADAASKIQDPEVLSNVARALKQPLQLSPFSATEREGARRIEEYARTAMSRNLINGDEQSAQAVMMFSPSAQIDVEMDNHQAYITYYKDWWVSDESRNAIPSVKIAVKLTVQAHKQAMVQNITDQKTDNYETQIPDKMAQVASNQIDAAQQGQVQQQQAEQQSQQAAAQVQQQARQQALEQAGNQQELAHQAAQNELSARDREHNLAVKMADREHQQAMRPA
jgi:hypothetical protein